MPASPLLLPIVAIVLSIVLCVTMGTLGRWLAAALILGIGWRVLVPVLERSEIARFHEPARRHLPHFLFAALWLWSFWELLLGRPPASRDHGIHYFQTHVLVNDLIPTGRLLGWSDALNVGYPFGDSYPILGYVITGLPYLLTGGLVSLRTSYALGLLAIWTLSAWAVWRTAAIVVEELRDGAEDGPSPAWAGCIAASLWLLDPGGSRQGGWNYLVFHGVWPQLLSTALWMAAFPCCFAACKEPTPRRIALAGLCLGGSVLAHPFGMFTVALGAIAWPIVAWASGRLERLPPGALRVWLGIHLLGALVCVGWLIAFLASSRYMGRSPVPWKPFGHLATQLLAGELFDNHRAFTGPLAVIGAAFVLRRRSAFGISIITLLLGLLLLGSEASVTVLRLDLLVSAFKNMQFPRFSIAAKPLLHVLSGVGGAFALSALARVPVPTPRVDPMRAIASTLAALVFAPVVVTVVEEAGRFVSHPVAALQTLEGSVHVESERELRAALQAEAEQLGDEKMVVAFLRERMGGGTYPLFSITDVRAHVILDSHVPAVNYRYRIRRRSAAAMHSLGVTHVIHDRPLEKGDRGLVDHLDTIGTFGPFTLTRLRPLPAEETPLVARLDPRLTGPDAELEPVSIERERIVFDVVAMEKGARLLLNLGDYRKWQASDSQGRLQTKVRERFSGVPATEVDLRGPGRVELRYVTPPLERVLGFVSVIAIVLAFAALPFGRPLALRAIRPSPTMKRVLLSCFVLAGACVLALSVSKQRRQLVVTWRPVLDRYHDEGTFVRDLVVARRFSVIHDNPRRCDGLLGKDALASCNERAERPRVATMYRSPYLYRCLDVQVGPGGTTWVRFRVDGDAIGFVRQAGGRQDLSIRLPGDEHSQNIGRDRLHFRANASELSTRTSGPEFAGVLELELSNSGPAAQHACIAVAELSPD